MSRFVEVNMVWSELIVVEVPDDWPLVEDLDGLPDGSDIRPLDPMTDSVRITDDGPEEVPE